MKLYYFNPNDYGDEFFVMAKNKTMAFESLMAYFNRDTELDHKDDLRIWKKINPLDPTSFPMKYTLDEYGEGEIIRSETS